MAIIRYPINQRIGLTYRRRYLKRNKFIKYLKRWNPKITKAQINKRLRESKVVLKQFRK